ncbi:SpoIIE family protein phosphatase [Streptacidiphilus sp. ASG 303]|uniref:SpoIIE family protein phosphatase n=1 Tax=Streptacidiphilus sp. ASG 303 TaxID=2896847 RepID=UPI001E609655|nr:SpoIIE family protein phosphatase [Streptacidiphilus sp. ASG 303]MCD0481017.1 SpoIIE family protein phosphatase [Streptacidiphilus sp. ASG 303]
MPTRTGHGGPGVGAVTGAAGPDGEESWPLDAALLGALRETGAAAAWLYLLSADRRVLVLAVLCGLPPEFIAPWTRIGTTAPLPVAEAVRDQRLVWVGGQEDLVRCYPRTALVLPYAFSLAAAPVTGARRWGAVLLVWPGERPAAESDRERSAVGRTCARLAALLDERAAADAPLEPPAEPRVLPAAAGRGVRQPRETAAAFAERLPGGSCALDLEGRITFVTLGAARLLGRPAEDLLGELPWRALPWLDDPLYEDRYRSAVISRRPASFTACRPPDRWLRFRLYPDAGGISVRVTSAGTGPRPAEPVPEPAPGGGHAGAGRLYRLMHLAAALTEATGVEDVVDLVADQIMPAFGAQSLTMATVEGDRLRTVGRRGYPAGTADHLGGLSLRDTSDPAVRSLRSGTPVFFASPEELERVHPAVRRGSDRQAWAFLPLVASGRPVGCCVLAYDRPRPFGVDERAVLASLAGLLGQALERARLYDAKNRLACGLQRGLLPRALPSLPGLEVAARYLPATRGMDIGGDFYDLIRLDATTAAAVIGDVQGHNVAAAALMGQVRTAVHAYAMAGAPPDEVLARTNRLLTDLDQGLFTSCLYARIDLARHRACLANAGHPPPLLCGAGGPAGPIDVPPGLLLGIDPGADYPLTEVPMPPGSLLALYTDGLVEEPGTDLDRATADLALHLDTVCGRDLEALADDLLDHALPGGRRTDDTALLLLRAAGRE